MESRLTPDMEKADVRKNPLKEMQDQGLVKDCALLCFHIYDEVTPILLKGWKILLPSTEVNSYKGACYYNDTEKTLKIAFVHRGTVINYGNLKADIKILMEKIPTEYFNSAMEFINLAWKEVNRRFTKKQLETATVVQTGHSLGAATSNLCLVATSDFNEEDNRLTLTDSKEQPLISDYAIGFENPGVKPMAIKYLEQRGFSKEKIDNVLPVLSFQTTNFQAHANIINTCNEQLGDIYVLEELIRRFQISSISSPFYPVPAKFSDNPFYVVANTMDQHEMKNILNYLSKGGSVSPHYADYAFGLQKGYVQYLGENDWPNYFQAVWSEDPNIRELFKNKYDDFQQKAYEKLQDIIDQAREISDVEIQKGTAKLIQRFNPPYQTAVGDFVVINKNEDEAKENYSFCKTM